MSKLIFPLIVFSLILAACGPQAPSSTTKVVPVATKLASVDLTMSSKMLEELETENFNRWKSIVRVEEMSSSDKLAIETVLTTPKSEISFSTAVFNTGTGSYTIVGDSSAILVPALMLTAQNANSIAVAAAPYAQQGQVFAFDALFHWTSHVQDPYNVSQAGSYFKLIYDAAMSGRGVVAYRSASDVYQGAYYFFAKVDGRNWAVVLSESNGAPITGYALNGKTLELAVASGKVVVRDGAAIIRPEDVPTNITDAWSKVPPVLRFVWWTVEYWAKMSATSVVDVFSKITVPIILIPSILLCPPDKVYQYAWCQGEKPVSQNSGGGILNGN